jgi:DNA-binding GntR family transcriptional regulator
MAEIVAKNDSDAFAAANLAFHTLIYAGAHNEIITEFAGG